MRALHAVGGAPVDGAGPSSVVNVVGFRGHPAAGDELTVVPSEKTAVALATQLANRRALAALRQSQTTATVPRTATASEGDDVTAVEEVPIMIKADVDGALEAIVASLMSLPSQEIALKVISASVGQVSEHDVQVAATAGAVIYTFNCRSPGAAVKKQIKSLKVEVRDHTIIYDLIDDVTRDLIVRLPPVEEIQTLATASVLQVFELKGKGTVAGCSVADGTFVSDQLVQVVREGEVVHEGKVSSLRRHKDEVQEIPSGSECGILLESFTGFEAGDDLRCIKRQMNIRTSL